MSLVASSPMQNRQNWLKLVLYFTVITLIILMVGLLKRLSLFVANEYLYSIPIMGDLLESIEIIELANVVIFALLGLFVGVSTLLFPGRNSRTVSALILILTIPLIFTIPSWVRYQDWLHEVSIQETLSLPAATKLTNTFLEKNVNQTGFLGFYLYTGKYPVIPSNRAEMVAMEEVDTRIKKQFTQLLSSQAKFINFFYSSQGWLIRSFYFMMSVIATIFHYHQGLQEADFLASRRRRVPRNSESNSRQNSSLKN